MNLTTMYIISWFGNDDVRPKRVEYHNNQINWAKQQGLKLVVYAQDYQPNEYQDGVTYIINDGTLKLPSTARNVLLAHFYKTDKDYAIFADNDSVLYDKPQHCDSKDFVKKFNAVSIDKLKDVDFFFPLNPGKVPFTKTITDNQQMFDDNFVFNRSIDSKGSFSVLKNLRKHYGVEFYYDEVNYKTADNKIIAGEDVDFGMTLLQNGYSCYMLHNIILKEYGSTTSTWSTEARSNDSVNSRAIKIKKFNLTTSASGRLNYKVLYKNNTKPSKLFVSKK